MALTLDQSQTTGATGVGFGQLAAVRYRAQGFTPSVTRIDGFGFYFNGNKGTQGIRAELWTLSGGNPTGSLLASAQLTNAQLSATAENVVPVVYSGLSTSTEYAIVLMPWDTTGTVYADDYRDCVFVLSDAYAAGHNWKYDTGAWVVESIDFKFNTYYDAALLGGAVSGGKLTMMGVG